MSEEKKFWAVSELIKSDLPKPGWIWEGWIPDKGLTIFAGRPGLKKSLVAQAFALHLVKGEPFLRSPVKKGSVLVLDSENSINELASRFKCLNTKIKIEEEKDANAFVWSDSKVTFTHIGLKNLEQKIKEYNPLLIIFDSFIRFFHNLDENSSKDMRIVFDCLQPILRERAILILHHAVKGKGRIDSQSVRGSGDLHASASSVIVFNQGPNNLLEIMQDKNRQGPLTEKLLVMTRQEKIGGLDSTDFVVISESGSSQTVEDFLLKWINTNIPANTLFKSGQTYRGLPQFSETELRNALKRLSCREKIRYVPRGKWLKLP